MSRESAYRAAVANAREKQARFAASAKAAKDRIAPARLKADVKEGIVQSMDNAGQRLRTTVREHPIATSAVGLASVVWFARRPLTALFQYLFVRFNNTNAETDNG